MDSGFRNWQMITLRLIHSRKSATAGIQDKPCLEDQMHGG